MKKNTIFIIGGVFILAAVMIFFAKGKTGPSSLSVVTDDMVPVEIYYDNGNLKALRYFKEEQLTGPYKVYYENGQIRTEGQYANGQMQGTFRRYYADGTLKAKEEYDSGVLTKVIRYDESGKIISQ